MGQVLQFFVNRKGVILTALYEHAYITLMASLLACVAGLLLGILISRYKSLRGITLGVVGFLYTIPALSLFFFLIPIMGIGTVPAVTALFIYGLLPIVQNTYVGIQQVDAGAKEAAHGMGVTEFQLLTRVELPLALPVIVAGIKTMVVMNISIATIAVFIGAGGMGTLILKGIRTFNDVMTIAGTITIAGVAILTEQILGFLERRIRKSTFGK
ncbi:hypothetical protein SY88_10940 [Clostridiales bacterium PH28_bin88]|nr:hypothetical protein SY88_10940 [Clostridiales bacterium PH28_bin88]